MISVRNVTLRRGVNVVLDSASVTFTPGEKIGLVGRNGAGKSSFFGLLNGTLHEDGGEFSIPAAWKMGQVAQEMPETEPPLRPATMACAWRTPTWPCTTPVHMMPPHAPRR